MSDYATHQKAPPQRADPQRAATHQPVGATYGAITPVKRLQRSLGNRALSTLLRSPVIQPKLEVSNPDDEYEREADRVADEVMRMPEPQSTLSTPHTTSPIAYSQSQETPRKPAMTLARAPIRINRMCTGCEADHKERESEAQSQIEEKEEEKEEEDEEDKFVQATFAAADPPQVPGNVERDLNNSTSQFSPAEPETEPEERKEELNEQGIQPILSNIGPILSSMALSLVVPVLRMPLAPIIQRRANVSLAPGGLPCILMDVTGTPGELSIMFTQDRSSLSTANRNRVRDYAGLWVSRGLSPDLIISGYASIDGTEPHNWRLSCERAEAVKAELARIGVPDTKMTTFAHGETTDFDATNLPPNRRATIESTPGTGPVITTSLVPNDDFPGRNHARFGLAETIFVDYSATPPITAAEHFGVEWASVVGTGTIQNFPGGFDIYTAGHTPATERLALIVSTGPAAGTQLVTVDIPIIAPASAYMTQVPGSGLCHTTGTAGVGFRGTPFLLPSDVSFTGIQMREGAAVGLGLGSLSRFNGAPHAVGGFSPVGTGNIATGCPVLGTDTVVTVARTPFTFMGISTWLGLFVWPIPWEYQAPGGPIVPFELAVHLCRIDHAGTASISKAGAGPFSVALGAAPSCIGAVGPLPPLCC